MLKKQIFYIAVLGIIIANNRMNATQIIGIYNNLPENGEFAVTTSLSQGVIGKAMPFQTRMRLPAKIFVQQERSALKTIIVREQQYDPIYSKPCSGKAIEAFVEGYEQETRQVICSTDALNEDYPELRTDFLQNIIVALAKRDKTDSSWPQDLNFIFAISAWSTTKKPWDSKIIATYANDLNKPFMTNNEPKPLSVLQGYNAWGNGTLPLMGHPHLVHIYNNTPYMLIMKRRGTSKQLDESWRYFEKAVPPYSAIPWAMAWIPKAPSDKISKAAPDIGEITILTLGAPYQGKAPIGLSPIQDFFGEQADALTEDAKNIVKRMKDSVPDEAETITGQKDLYKEFLKEKNFYTSNYLYKLITDADKNRIVVQRCNMVNQTGVGSVSVSNCYTILDTQTKAFDGSEPTFYTLTINPYVRPAGLPQPTNSKQEEPLSFEFKQLTVDEL